MLLYDDTAAAVLQAAAGHARRSGAERYSTVHVLLGLLGSADPVTRAATGAAPELTVEAVATALDDGTGRADGDADGGAVRSPAPAPVPAAEFRRAMSGSTARWRTLVTSGRLRPGGKLGTGELWLAVLQPDTASADLLTALGAEPEGIRSSVLAAMVPAGRPVPEWPAEAPTGAVRRLIGRVLGTGARP
jgi:hypothetical protein